VIRNKRVNLMPLISIIVPVYNVQAYLDRCVKSILRQTFKEFELILVDDGSPDRCPSMCDDWAKKDERIRVIHQKNQGLSAARNNAMKIAKGKYISFIDSDDWIADDMLEDLLKLLVKYDADISVCNLFRTTDEKQKPDNRNESVHLYTKDEFMHIILRVKSNRCIHYACGKLYKKECLWKNEHYPVGMLNEDVEGMFKAVLCSERIVETSKKSYYYYENLESISRKKFGKNFLCLTDVWSRIVDISKQYAPEYLEYVVYNFKRSDFTILMDLILFGDKQIDQQYQKERTELKARLRSNMRDLLKSPMSLNRKIMMMAVAYCYEPTKIVVRKIKHR